MIRHDRADNGDWILETEQRIERPLDEVFAFFADAANLEAITPPWLSFRIVTPTPITMREGAIIDYRLRLRGVPIRWRTRIDVWEPGRRFVDMQVRGPYALWRHEHVFDPLPGGAVRVRDRVTYRHLGGALINRLLVRPDLERIFRHRHERTEQLLEGRTLDAASAA